MFEKKSGRSVRIILKNNFHFSGIIKKENETHLTLDDKFGKEVIISKDSISIMEVIG